MAPEKPRGARPGPVVLRIKLRYDDVEAMVQRFAPNVGKTGIFLPTKSLQPLEAEIKFELRLANDQPALVGLGRVKAVCAPDPENPRAAFGMAIELLRVTRESRDLILRMLERRKQLGLAELGLPMPADVEAARRGDLVDTGIRSPDSGPVAVPVPTPNVDSSPSEQLLTAPRRQSGPIAIAKLTNVEPLAPETPRKRRVPIGELIETASGPIGDVQVPGLDDEVDVAAVLARARMLAGSDLDVELEALRDSAATPIAIDIEAASAELARQLGGAPVRRDRSARWERPPEVAARPEIVVEPAVETSAPEAVVEPAVAAVPEVAPVPVVEAAPAPVVEAAPEPEPRLDLDSGATPITEPPDLPGEDRATDRPHAFDRISAEPSDGLIHDAADARAFGEVLEVEPEQIHDEIHRLDEGDFEEVERTQIGDAPVDPRAFDHSAYATVPSEQAELAARLDAQLAEAEAEAAADDLGIAAARRSQQFSIDGTVPATGDFVIQLGEEAAAPVFDAPTYDPQLPEEDIEEVDDFEILAEADAADADLLASDAEGEVSGSVDVADAPMPVAHESAPDTPAPPDEPPARPSFLSRLDFDDDSGDFHRPQLDEAAENLAPEPGEIDPRILSAGQALAAFEEPEEPSEFTPLPQLPARPDSDQGFAFPAQPGDDAEAEDFDGAHGNYGGTGFIPPDAFDQSDVISIRAPTPIPELGEDEYDLETALEALDVDLDDLSAGTELPSERSRNQRPIIRAGANRLTGAPTTPKPRIPKRAATDDGVLIDFDDDE